mgnify:CR=1 FL=1
MALSDKYGGKPRPSLVKRTLAYIAVFGLGALLIATVLSFTLVSIAESVLPPAKSRRNTTKASDKTPESKKDSDKKGTSKARRGRANDGPKSNRPL